MDQTAVETVVNRQQLYRRELPGAGYVAMDLMPANADDTSESGSLRTHIRICVERRASEERRVGHTPPVVAEFTGDDSAPEVGELYRMAADNVALARALLEWQGRQARTLRAD